MAKLYVVAKFEEAPLARAVMDMLEDHGHEITHDWTDESTTGLSGVDVSGLFQQASIDDIEGVRAADAVVVLHHEKLKGGLVEIGAALGCQIPVIVVGGRLALDVPIFYWHSDVLHVANVDDALKLLETLFPPQDRAGDQAVEEEDEPVEPEPTADCPCPECAAQQAVDAGLVPEPHVLYFVGVA